MSLYNTLYGMNPATFFALPMITDQHPEQLPRFRDCFIGRMTRGKEKDQHNLPTRETDDSEVLTIYTRTGGNNRSGYYVEGNEALRKIEGFIEDYDDSFDETFACWIYHIPEAFKGDFELIKAGRFGEISQELQERCYKMYPKLKGPFNILFMDNDQNED